VERNHQRQKDIIAEQLARNRLDRNYMHGCHDLHKDVFMQSMILLGFNMGTAGTAFLITYFVTSCGLKHRWALALVPSVVGIATSALGGFVIYNNQRSQKPDPNFRRV
jgi:ABC-type antimicrobial peptide transport system permease subunit